MGDANLGTVSEPRRPTSDNRSSVERGSADLADSPPEVVGRYSLFGKVASGGMATVHLGRLLGPVGFSRTVAIKKLHAHLAQDPDFVLAFVDEARLAARIQHPNIVSTLDVVSEKGQLLLVMEYVMGESLLRLLSAVRARGDLVPPKIAASIVSSALHGLHAAHEAKNDRGQPLEIVHRDVSPHNIMVGSDGVTRVLDFGVAKAMGRMQATGDGVVKGKVAYMAPEQVRGERVDRRCDVYAAGVVLWETLTGRRLFHGETQVETFARVMAGCPAPPSEHVPDLPQAFDDVTMRALRSDPRERFGTAREMAMALEACAGIATPSEVGPWVTSLASDVLQLRARAVADVESSSDIVVMHSEPPAPLGREGEPTQSGSVSGVRVPGDAAGAKVRRLTVMGMAGGGALVLVLATWLLASRTGGTRDPVATPAPSPSIAAVAPPVATVPPQAETAAASAASASVPTAASAASARTAGSAAGAVIAPRSPSPVRPQSFGGARAPARPNCTPPYTVDANGFRVPKPECL